jgi:hypothetical protein
MARPSGWPTLSQNAGTAHGYSARPWASVAEWNDRISLRPRHPQRITANVSGIFCGRRSPPPSIRRQSQRYRQIPYAAEPGKNSSEQRTFLREQGNISAQQGNNSAYQGTHRSRAARDIGLRNHGLRCHGNPERRHCQVIASPTAWRQDSDRNGRSHPAISELDWSHCILAPDK